VGSLVEGSSTKKNLNTGDLVATLAVTRRLGLTDEQWARLESLLPVPTRSGDRRSRRNGSSSTGSGGGCGSVRPGGTPGLLRLLAGVYALFGGAGCYALRSLIAISPLQRRGRPKAAGR
jgi:hypothetical protein